MTMINEERLFQWVTFVEDVKRSKANPKRGFARDCNFSEDKGTATKDFKHTEQLYNNISPLDFKLTRKRPKRAAGDKAVKMV